MDIKTKVTYIEQAVRGISRADDVDPSCAMPASTRLWRSLRPNAPQCKKRALEAAKELG